ncbi:MAG: response regulator [Pirellulales bacterium]
MSIETIVHIVDDDPEFRESLNLMVGSVGLIARMYSSAEEFLNKYENRLDQAECILLDIRMPGMGGLKLLEKLVAMELMIPVIMITAYGDVQVATRAMRAGAVDFFEKPINRQVVLEQIYAAIKHNELWCMKECDRHKFRDRLALLTNREREVMDRIITGEESKQTSARLGIDVKTVLKHRARVLEKLQVDTSVNLVHLAYRFGLVSPNSNSMPE